MMRGQAGERHGRGRGGLIASSPAHGFKSDRLGTEGLRPGQAPMPTPGWAERKRRGPQEEGPGRGQGMKCKDPLNGSRRKSEWRTRPGVGRQGSRTSFPREGAPRSRGDGEMRVGVGG